MENLDLKTLDQLLKENSHREIQNIPRAGNVPQTDGE
jgi:hypothetical protein